MLEETPLDYALVRTLATQKDAEGWRFAWLGHVSPLLGTAPQLVFADANLAAQAVKHVDCSEDRAVLCSPSRNLASSAALCLTPERWSVGSVTFS